MSLGLHALNTALVFAFMRRLGIGQGPSAFAAGLFGLHPLHVESVAWAAERKDVLSMAFGLMTLLAYLRYAEAPSRGRMAVVTWLLVLGLMAKPMLVTLPFVLLLLDWWPLRRVGSPTWIASPYVAAGASPRVSLEHLSGRSLLLEKAPLFAVLLLSCAVTYVVQKGGGAVIQRMPLAFRLENAAHSYVLYLKKFIFPTHLACIYPMVDLGAGRVALSVAALAVATLIAWRLRRTRPYLLVGWLWFVGALVPVIGLVQVGGQAYADRYTYFPSLGIGFAASLGLADAVGWARLPRPAVILATCAYLAVLGVATSRQTLVWRNSAELFEHALAATGHNWFIRLLLASELIENDEFERAEVMLQQSLTDGAPPARIHEAMSVVYDRQNREEEALREIDRALTADPDNWHMLVNRGVYLTNLRRDAEAVAVLERAIALDQGNNPKQLAIAHRALVRAQGRLREEGGPGGVPAAPR